VFLLPELSEWEAKDKDAKREIAGFGADCLPAKIISRG